MTGTCLVNGHPHHVGGCIIDGPLENAAPVPPAQPMDLPEPLEARLAHFGRVFFQPAYQPRPVLEHEAERLARTILTYAPADQVQILAGVFLRLGLRGGR